MAEVLTEKEKIKRLKISLIIAFAVILIVGLRIVKCNDDRVLIFSVDSDNAWVLIPTTIHTNHGEIHLRLFTKVEHSDGYLSYVINKKGNIKQNLVIRGNKIENFHSVSINRGGGFQYDSYRNDPQPFVIEGVELEIGQFEVRRMSTDPDFVQIFDFTEIKLTDGTVIAPGISYRPYFWLKYGYELNEWELYYNTDSSHFIVTNPSWEGEKHIWSIIFEKNWGKLISYEETMNPITFEELR